MGGIKRKKKMNYVEFVLKSAKINPSLLDENQSEDFEERAAIMEYDGKLPREQAVWEAWKRILKKYQIDV